jgi:ABC-type multidrug transport system fused ATPase/permease subunit
MKSPVAVLAAPSPPPAAAASSLPALHHEGRGRLLAWLAVLGVAQALLAALAALGMRRLFDGAVAPAAGSAATVAATLAAMTLLLALTQLALRQWSVGLSESLGQRYVAAVRTGLLQHLFRMAPAQHQGLRHGHLLTRLTGDLAALRRWVGQALAPLIVGGAAVSTMVAAALLWRPLWGLALAAALAMAGAAAWLVSVRLELRLREERRQRWALAGQVGERLAVAAVVQSNGQSTRELERLARRQQRVHDAAVARARSQGWLKAVPTVLAALSLAGVLGWGGVLVAQGQWSAGALAGLVTGLSLALVPTRDLVLGLGAWRAWRVSREKLEGFLQLPTLGAGQGPVAAPLAAQAYALQLALTPAGSAADVHVAPRTSLGVHGPSGAGKSRLLQALAGLHTEAGLRIRLDDRPLEACTQAQLARRVSCVAAELPLLRGTIASNLRYRLRIDEAEQWQVLLQAGAAPAVAALPKGLATPVHEGGRNLPHVLRLRLALARALVGSPGLLLIDDFEHLLEGDSEADAPLARLLQAPPCTLVAVVRHAPWRARCHQTLCLPLHDAGSPVPNAVHHADFA